MGMRSENGRANQAKSPAAPKMQIAMVSTIEIPTMRPARRDCCLNRVLSPESVMPEEASPAIVQGEAQRPSCKGGVYHVITWPSASESLAFDSGKGSDLLF